MSLPLHAQRFHSGHRETLPSTSYGSSFLPHSPFSRTRLQPSVTHRSRNEPGSCRLCRGASIVRHSQASSPAASISSAQEAAALDELIDSLMKAPNQPEFEKLVAENILSFDQKFWIRVATRSDAAEPAQKDKLSTLARSVMLLVDAIVKRTSLKMSDSASVLQEIVRAAADERGEWHLPLTAQQRAAMQQAMEERSEHLDEALLSNAYAWMRKASDDGLEGVVGLIQKVLQVYAALALKINSPDKTEIALNEVLATDEGSWAIELQERKVRGNLDEAAFMAAIRRRMERVVLTLDSGSHAQRIQAEFLKELETRSQGVLQQHGGF